MADLDYRAWIRSAQERLDALERHRQAIEMEIAALKQSIAAFEPLINAPFLDSPYTRGEVTGGLPNFSLQQAGLGTYTDVGLTEAVRTALKTSSGPLEPTEVRDVIVHGGFDLSGRSNPMANIHQVLRRLVNQGEAKELEDVDGKTRYESVPYAGLKDSINLGRHSVSRYGMASRYGGRQAEVLRGLQQEGTAKASPFEPLARYLQKKIDEK